MSQMSVGDLVALIILKVSALTLPAPGSLPWQVPSHYLCTDMPVLPRTLCVCLAPRLGAS